MSYLIDTYARLPVTFAKGQGAVLWDTEGRRYLDAVAGVAVNGLGHAHPKLVAALTEQIGDLIHTSNLYRIANQEKLAEELARVSGMRQAFFCNSGAEANEAAIKLARLYGHKRGIELPTIVVTEHSFHGRTMATLTATGSRKVQAGFEPLVAGFTRVPYDDIEAIRKLAATQRNIVAVLVEPVQGEGGVHTPSAGYLKGLRELCDEQGWLLMLDEVQTGIARTGKWFAHQHAGIVPDVMSLAKGLGSGVPIGGILVNGPAVGVFTPGTHGCTFGGNPLATAAGLATLRIIEEEGLIDRASQLGERLRDGFRTQLNGVAGVRGIRSHGLMLGIELDVACGEIVTRALNEGLLINVTAEKVIRMVPPFVLTDAQADELVDRVSALVRQFLADKTAPAA